MKTTLSAPIGRTEALQGRPEAATPTPQPWRITVCEATGAIWIERRTGGTKEAVCKMGPNFSEGLDLANAELILAALAERDRIVAENANLHADVAIQNEMIDGARSAASRLMIENDRLKTALESSLRVFRAWLHDVDPYNELGMDNPDRAAAVIMIECCSKALNHENT